MLIIEYPMGFVMFLILHLLFWSELAFALDVNLKCLPTYMQISILDNEFLRKQFHFGPKLLLKYPFRFENAHIHSALKSAKKSAICGTSYCFYLKG